MPGKLTWIYSVMKAKGLLSLCFGERREEAIKMDSWVINAGDYMNGL